MSLQVDELDERTVEGAGVLIAREHAAARRMSPELPEAYLSVEVCVADLQRLRDSGHRGLVVSDRGRLLAVGATTVRQASVIGDYAKLPAEGLAVAPDLVDATAVVSSLWGELAQPLVAGGVRQYYLVHPVIPAVHEALFNMGFGRDSCYAVRRVAGDGSSAADATTPANQRGRGDVMWLLPGFSEGWDGACLGETGVG